MESFINKYRETLLQIRLNILDENYYTSNRLSNYLTRVSAFIDEKNYVFISEMFEYLISNIYEIVNNYKVSDEDKTKINTILTNLIDFITKEIPITDTKKDMELLELLKEARFLVTKMQLYYFTQKPKTRRERFPPDFIIEESKENE